MTRLSSVRRHSGIAASSATSVHRLNNVPMLDGDGRTVARHFPTDVVRFAHDLKVPPPSNQAERDLRAAKIQQNISGWLASDHRTQDRYTIRESSPPPPNTARTSWMFPAKHSRDNPGCVPFHPRLTRRIGESPKPAPSVEPLCDATLPNSFAHLLNVYHDRPASDALQLMTLGRTVPHRTVSRMHANSRRLRALARPVMDSRRHGPWSSRTRSAARR